tara:strand:- start:2804 stop:4069 length:1266 start_codon:yes stop_codon:yes gene_type:complete
MALGALSVIGQLVGAGLNTYLGAQQRKDAETLIGDARDALLATAGPSDELLSSVDEQKRLAQRSGDLARERLDQSMTSFLDALASGDPSAFGATQNFGTNLAQAEQQLGFTTAQQIADANQPAVKAAEDALNVSRGLSQFDLERGTQAFDAGTQTLYSGIGSALNIPTDLASLQVTNPDAYAQLFPGSADQGIKTKSLKDQIGDLKLQIEKAELEKELSKYASGGVVYGGAGINMRTLSDILQGLDQGDTVIQEDPEEEVEEEVNQDQEEGSKRQSTPHESRMKQIEETEAEKRVSEYIRRRMREGKGTFDMGGTVDKLLRPGESFKTGGKEDHDAQEYNIEDAKTGEVVAKTTGQETHMVNEDGTITVMNSEQTESIHDAFKDVDVDMVLKALKGNPQKSQVRELLSALNKVYSQKQFQS